MIKKLKTIINSNIGFTLVELMVVISVISVLSTIGTISFAGSIAKARDAKKINDANLMILGLQIFATNTDRFPTASELLQDDVRWMNFLNKIGGMGMIPSNSTSYYCYFVNKTNWTNAVIIATDFEGDIPNYSSSITPSNLYGANSVYEFGAAIKGVNNSEWCGSDASHSVNCAAGGTPKAEGQDLCVTVSWK